MIGIVTYGNASFTKMAIESIFETTKQITERDIVIIVGLPGDGETSGLAAHYGIPHFTHGENRGFPASLNDIYDYCWGERKVDNIIMMGNDVMAYPYSIDSLIKVAETTNFEWICSKEYSVKAFIRDFPHIAKYFQGGSKLIYRAFNEKLWLLAKPYAETVVIHPGGLSDVHNLALFKKSVFDKIGYIDVNFYPAYFEDNDYARRGVNAGILSCTLVNSIYFHFWSRTIHQGKGSSTKQFKNNSNFYKLKWGGEFGSEAYSLPFNGHEYSLAGAKLQPSLKIDTRIDEDALIKYWRHKS